MGICGSDAEWRVNTLRAVWAMKRTEIVGKVTQRRDGCASSAAELSARALISGADATLDHRAPRQRPGHCYLLQKDG